MALEVPEELIPLERCLKKDQAKLKNGRPGTKAFEQSRLTGPKRSLRAEQHVVVAQVLSVGLGSQRNWIFLLNCCCSVTSASLGRGSGCGAGQERRGTFGDFCENPRESGLVEGQEGNQGDTRKDNGVGDSWGSSEGQEQ